jgi:hypothetical protein
VRWRTDRGLSPATVARVENEGLRCHGLLNLADFVRMPRTMSWDILSRPWRDCSLL